MKTKKSDKRNPEETAMRVVAKHGGDVVAMPENVYTTKYGGIIHLDEDCQAIGESRMRDVKERRMCKFLHAKGRRCRC